MTSIDSILRLAPVIPVLTLHDPKIARPLAEILVDAGLRVLEVTLRTPAACDVIAEMAGVEGAVIGAGTVLNEDQLNEAMNAGAAFAVSPGLTNTLATAARERALPYLPGIATASDIQLGLELGFEHFKFFPAVANGGISALQALAAPFQNCSFCPTGGVSLATAPDWLAMDSVICVGGNWLAPQPSQLDDVRQRAVEAAALRRAAARHRPTDLKI